MSALDTVPGRARQFAGVLADVEALIADRGGADSMYANDPAKLRACNKWVNHARPIIKAMFAVEDAEYPITVAWLDADKGRKFAEPLRWQQRDYDEAKGYLADVCNALYAMLDGIRDTFIADERCGWGDADAQADEALDFNDWLDASTITVDQAVRIVTDEHNDAFARRAA